MISKPTRQLFQKQKNRSYYGLRSLLLMLAIGFFSITASAQVATWTGAVDTDWENPANWNPSTIPTATDDVIIPDVSPNVSPVISSAVTVKSIEIETGGQLTVSDASGNTISQLTILNSDDVGLLNNGTLVNNRSIRIGTQNTNDPSIPIGILNNGSITNGPTGIITGESSIGTPGDFDTKFILNNGQITNEGSIRGAGLSSIGLEIDQMGTLTNTGAIIFFNTQEALPLLIKNGTVNNQENGQFAFFGGDRIQIEADGVINNIGCGAFGHTNGFINNGQINNDGYFFSGFVIENGLTILPSLNTGTFINQPNGSLIIYSDPEFEEGSNPIENSGIYYSEFEAAEVPLSCTATTSYSPFVNFDPSNFTVEFFSDANGNTSAGTFDNTTNTFTPNDLNQTEFFVRIANPACENVLPTIFPYNIIFVEVDEDMDNISDCDDLCLDTPIGEAVNADGCACSQLTVDDGEECTEDICVAGVVTNTFQDADGDGICDANDSCDNTMADEAVNDEGCSCSQITVDDGNPCTEDICVAGVVTSTFQDADGDGICDANDSCDNTMANEAVNDEGCSCSQITVDDGNPCTEDICVAGVVTSTFQDADGDGICDANDDCDNTPTDEATNQDGCACSQLTVDDGEECTEDICVAGVVTNTFQDADGDGICDVNDDCDNTPTDEATNQDGCACSQLTVDDGDPCTEDVCVDGVVTSTFQDADGDMTCDANDGCPNDPNKTEPGLCGCGVEETPDCGNPSIYCPAMGESTEYEWIQNVGINDEHNTSGDDGGYGDYTSTNFSLTTGNNNIISLTPGFSGDQYYEYWTVYIDLNQDGDFFDAGELVYGKNTAYGFIDCLHIPNSATLGTTQMRVIMSYNGWAYPCDTFQDGEVEDYTVTISEPIITYCDAEGNNSNEEWIKKVFIGDIHNPTGNDGGYGDYTSLSNQMTQGETQSILLKPGFANHSYYEYWKVWVDWNQDGDFNDYGELEVAAGSYGNIWGHISVPHNAVTGPTRMRVAMKYGGWPSSCGDFTYGEVEDYTIMVTSNQSLTSQPDPNDVTIKLEATPKLNKVQLDWINDTGNQNDYFIVEKSLDGRNFEMITTVENQKRDQTMRNYTTTDIKAVKGVNYYRIKLIMSDGTERYSETQSATITQNPNLVTVYPNPTSEEVYINLKAYSGMGAQVMIVNNFGKIVHEESIKTIQKTTHRIDLDRLQAGHYTISILVEGRKRIAKPLVIVRM